MKRTSAQPGVRMAYVSPAASHAFSPLQTREHGEMTRYLRGADPERYPVLAQEEVVELMTQIRSGKPQAATAARERMICCNLRMVVSVARRYIGRSALLDLDDLIAEGTMGLMHALDLFEAQRGYTFGTYAMWWIRQSIVRAIAKSDAIRLPEHIWHARNRSYKERTLEMLDASSGAASAPRYALSEGEQSLLKPLSLNQELRQTRGARGRNQTVWETMTWEDLLPDESIEGQLELGMVASAARSAWRMALERYLTPREREVIALRYGLSGEADYGGWGLGNGGERTLAEVGQRLKLSRQRVQQLEEAALAKLRVALSADAELASLLRELAPITRATA